ncbi:MAG: tRNA 2-thiouridine(34) synthase MnmA [Anaerolineales bacterium]
MNTNHNTTVVVAMSGGVDSSVTAALLKEQGYNVIGMMMRLWAEDTAADYGGHNRCCTPDQMADARRIANLLDIPFYVIDTKNVFRQKIVQFFIDEHSRGVTPNPCLECNRHIRFDWLLNHALAMDADYLATGHYARITRDEAGNHRLHMGRDPRKDQSYVLSVLTQEKINRALFPIGDYEKPEVRRIADDLGLGVASKGDSQDLCFLGDGDYRRFLRDHADAGIFAPGEIKMRDGTVLGQHTGLPNYTIGQRKGLGVSYAEPLYVLRLDHAANALIVGTREELGARALTANRANWINGQPAQDTFRASVKIRYKATPAPATVTLLDDDQFRVEFDEPRRDITPGQGAVVYIEDRCLGGGNIVSQELA